MIRVQSEIFNLGDEIAKLVQGNGQIGAVVSFLGLVRDTVEIDGKPAALITMTLEHYPKMTERQLQELEQEARQRWELQAVLIIHRYGDLRPGDSIVLVATASAHRQVAFDACNFLIDWLKTKAPFWKHEVTTENQRWVDAKSSDDDAAKRWINSKS